jgi:hypothetical protein
MQQMFKTYIKQLGKAMKEKYGGDSPQVKQLAAEFKDILAYCKANFHGSKTSCCPEWGNLEFYRSEGDPGMLIPAMWKDGNDQAPAFFFLKLGIELQKC